MRSLLAVEETSHTEGLAWARKVARPIGPEPGGGTMRRVIWALAVGVAALPMAAFAATADQEVAQQIADSLRQSGRLKGYSIAVKYKEGTARLEGSVRNPQQLEQAAELVNQHPSVKRVINNLVVDANPAAGPGQSPHPSVPQPLPQAIPQTQRMEAVPTSASPANPASVLMSRLAPHGAAAQPFRQASLPRPADSAPVARPVAAPMNGAPRPIQSVLAQAPPQPIQGRVPLSAQPISQPMYNPNVAAGRPTLAAYRQPPAPPVGMPGYGPSPEYVNSGVGMAPAVYDQPYMPNYAWPSYAPYPNYAALTYPKQYSPTAWPYIGPFYPYPQVPLGWRKVTLEWDDGWWFLNFADDRRHCGHY
jgi:hypothetical protein